MSSYEYMTKYVLLSKKLKGVFSELNLYFLELSWNLLGFVSKLYLYFPDFPGFFSDIFPESYRLLSWKLKLLFTILVTFLENFKYFPQTF